MPTPYQTRAAELAPAVSRMSRPEFRAYARGLSDFDQGALEVLLRQRYVAYLDRKAAERARQDAGLPVRAAPDEGYPSIATLEEWFGTPQGEAENAIEAERERSLTDPPAEITADWPTSRSRSNFEAAMLELRDRDGD